MASHCPAVCTRFQHSLSLSSFVTQEAYHAVILQCLDLALFDVFPWLYQGDIVNGKSMTEVMSPPQGIAPGTHGIRDYYPPVSSDSLG